MDKNNPGLISMGPRKTAKDAENKKIALEALKKEWVSDEFQKVWQIKELERTSSPDWHKISSQSFRIR